MASVASGFQSETSLDELLDDDTEHLICGCRPHLTLCGCYDPSSDVVIFKDNGPDDCADCVKVWESTGCGVCGCCSSWACVPCQQRYQQATPYIP